MNCKSGLKLVRNWLSGQMPELFEDDRRQADISRSIHEGEWVGIGARRRENSFGIRWQMIQE
jgi:hypothetical protein